MFKTPKKKGNRKKERDSRHFTPANKEWKNSVYEYNNKNILNLSTNNQLTDSLIKSYFNLVPVPTNITKSKRMRDLIRRSSTKQLFVSKPEIKQNNDKAIITVYTHDREKVFNLKKLFFLNKWLNTSLVNMSLFKTEKKKSYKYLFNKYNMHFLLTNTNIDSDRQLTFRRKQSILNRCISKFSVKPKLLSKTTTLLLKKKQLITNMLFYHYLKWILSLFKIKITITCITKRKKITKKKKQGLAFLVIRRITKVKAINAYGKKVSPGRMT